MCKKGWWGEDGARGCNETGQSCAQICPGDFEWKGLYQSTIDREIEIENECAKDPTATWGRHVSNPDGRYAVLFTGGMRNFAATWWSWKHHVIDASGGNVDLYFHVWNNERNHGWNPLAVEARDLALSLPQTKRSR
jgi:hypothetical protein